MTNPTADAAKLLPSRMRMADVKVGMRLVSTIAGGPAFSPITVTEITERGFRYKLDVPVCLHPLMGTTEGGEHFGYEGECYYEPESATKEVMPNTGQLRPDNATPPVSLVAPGADAPEPDFEKLAREFYMTHGYPDEMWNAGPSASGEFARQMYRLGLTRLAPGADAPELDVVTLAREIERGDWAIGDSISHENYIAQLADLLRSRLAARQRQKG